MSTIRKTNINTPTTGMTVDITGKSTISSTATNDYILVFESATAQYPRTLELQRIPPAASLNTAYQTTDTSPTQNTNGTYTVADGSVIIIPPSKTYFIVWDVFLDSGSSTISPQLRLNWDTDITLRVGRIQGSTASGTGAVATVTGAGTLVSQPFTGSNASGQVYKTIAILSNTNVSTAKTAWVEFTVETTGTTVTQTMNITQRRPPTCKVQIEELA